MSPIAKVADQVLRFRLQEAGLDKDEIAGIAHPEIAEGDQLPCLCALVSGRRKILTDYLPRLVVATGNQALGILVQPNWQTPDRTAAKIAGHLRGRGLETNKPKVLIIDQVQNGQITVNQWILAVHTLIKQLRIIELAEQYWFREKGGLATDMDLQYRYVNYESQLMDAIANFACH